jgi:hypothetical protein
MPRFEGPDLSSLASLARSQDLDLRPVLLRVHTDLFVAAPSRDRTTIEAFEALALGFLPIVDDATAAIVAHKLAPITDTPVRILDALLQRGGEARAAILERGRISAGPAEAVPRRGQAVAATTPHRNLEDGKLDELLALRDADVDLALARNGNARLSGPQLQQLVERARERPLLALALLDRRDLGAADEAVLYLHADDSRRRQIRSRLERAEALTGRGVQLPRADRKAAEVLLAHARALDIGPFEAQLTLMLRLTPPPAWRFQKEPRCELLALGLVAAGVWPEDCIRVFLTLPSISRSVRTVFDLAEVARTVSRPVAVHLIEAVLGATVEIKREGRYVPAADPSGTPVRDRVARPTLAQIRAAVQARRAG